MKPLLCATMIVALTVPAYAQGLNMNMLGGSTKPRTQDEVDAENARNSAYQSAIKKLPDQKPKNDPWGTVRSSTASQSDTKKTPSGAK